jgi:hypothetical protein
LEKGLMGAEDLARILKPETLAHLAPRPAPETGPRS